LQFGGNNVPARSNNLHLLNLMGHGGLHLVGLIPTPPLQWSGDETSSWLAIWPCEGTADQTTRFIRLHAKSHHWHSSESDQSQGLFDTISDTVMHPHPWQAATALLVAGATCWWGQLTFQNRTSSYL